MVSSDQARRSSLEDELPSLVVEVLSPGAANRARDLEDKFALYEAVGLPAYWVLDPASRVLKAWRLVDRELQPIAEVTGATTFHADWPWAVSLEVDGLI